MAAQPKQRLWGCLVATMGLLSAAAIRWHPERLHAPAWVAYSACAAFFFCGLTLLADASGRRAVGGPSHAADEVAQHRQV
jgi:hypothetical protein